MLLGKAPDPNWHPDFGANLLGCEPKPLREILAPDGQYRTSAYKKHLAQVRKYAEGLDLHLTPTMLVEPVFAEVLLKLSGEQA